MIGVYSIRNIVDNKRYIGHSKDIDKRFKNHKRSLTKLIRHKDVNRHLFDAVKQYGFNNFVLEVLEIFDTVDKLTIVSREMYWISYYNTCDINYGYNLRRDYPSGMITHDETRDLLSKTSSGVNNPNYGNYWDDDQKKRMSEISKERHSSGKFYNDDWKKKISNASKELWKDDIKKANMIEKVSLKKSKYRFYQYDKNTNELIKVWESFKSIIEAHPDYHNKAIYGVCSGTKKSYRGYIWKKELKI